MREYLRHALNLIRKPETGLPLPLHLHLELTNDCNLDCLTCSRKGRITDVKTLPIDRFQAIIGAIEPKRINLTGSGEPMMHRDFFKIVRLAKDKGIKVTVATNFTLAEGREMECIDSGIDLLKISIDAATEETYSEIKGANYFRKVLHSIRKLGVYKREKSTNLPRIRFNFVLQEKNIAESGEIIGLAEEMNAEAVYFKYPKLFDGKERNNIIPKNLDRERLKGILKEIRIRSGKAKVKTNVYLWERDLSLFLNRFGPFSDLAADHRSCFFPWFSTYIEADGSVRPCSTFCWVENEGTMGNCLKESFADIWNNEIYQRFRNGMKRREKIYKPCRACVSLDFSGLIKEWVLM